MVELTQKTLKEIQFYKFDDPYGFMSNFYPSPFEDEENRQWPTSEHYYQAMKHHEYDEYVEVIRCADTPGESFRLGNNSRETLRSDWE